jgi:hypothetical protein
MGEKENIKQLRKYAGQLADRMGLKGDISKVKDRDVIWLVLALRDEWRKVKYQYI